MKVVEFCSVLLLLIIFIDALRQSITSAVGCDYVRLHLRRDKNSNDDYDGIWAYRRGDFDSDPYIGLGLFKFQELTEEDIRYQTTHTDSSCQNFDALTSEMFLEEGNLNMVKGFTLCSQIVMGLIIIALSFVGTRLAFCSKKEQINQKSTARDCIFCLLLAIASALALTCQVLALEALYESDLCSGDEYFPTGWKENFLADEFQKHEDFEYFSYCKLGPEGRLAKGSIMMTGISCVLPLLAALALSYDLSQYEEIRSTTYSQSTISA